MSPRVFVGVPTLNRPDLVKETVRSVLAQRFRELRVVVSDNRSRPEVAEEVRAWIHSLDDPRVRFYQQAEDGGEVGQGRYFFGEAVEDYFIILHDDDVLEPEYVERAVGVLDAHPEADVFLANPYVIDWRGRRLEEETLEYLREHGRIGRPEGGFDLMSSVLEPGTAWISGACFRLSALRASGFVDPDLAGHYIELNVFLRLAENGSRGWFCAESLLGLRFHAECLRVYNGWDPPVVANTLRALERRRFRGRPERKRRGLLGFLHRATALHRLDEGDFAGCRAALVRAVLAYPISPATWKLALAGIPSPRLLRALLPPLREARFSADSTTGPRTTEATRPGIMRGRSA